MLSIRNSYFLIFQGDSNWGGEQGPKRAQVGWYGGCAKGKILTQYQVPLWTLQIPSFTIVLENEKMFNLSRLVIVITGLDMKNENVIMHSCIFKILLLKFKKITYLGTR